MSRYIRALLCCVVIALIVAGASPIRASDVGSLPLRLALRPDMPPYQFFDMEGRPQGLVVTVWESWTRLGYYINPLMNVALGCVFLRERPSRLQVAAIALAAFGVLWMLAGYGRFPWVALTLAGSFSLYGFMRKTVKVASVPGLFIETSILAPFVAVWLVRLHLGGGGAFMHLAPTTDLLLMGAGVATSTPLIWFAFAARSLRLTTVGVLQYLAPTLAFMLGVFVFHEPLTPSHLVTFGCIWGALALYTIEGWRALHRKP